MYNLQKEIELNELQKEVFSIERIIEETPDREVFTIEDLEQLI